MKESFGLNEPASMNLLQLLMVVGVACTVAPDAVLGPGSEEKILDISCILYGFPIKD